MMHHERLSKYVPTKTVYGNILGIFVLVMCFAFAWQAINAINLYAELRTNGTVIEGRWTASYVDPFTNEDIAAYSFVVDDKTYRGRQPNHTTSNQYVQGEPVDIVYATADPAQSRVAGTEGYSVQNVLELVISAIVAIFTLQFLFAYHTRRPAWIFVIYGHIRP